jgi:uncharacterized membrane protein
MTKTRYYLFGILSGLILYKLIYVLYALLLLVDFTPLFPYLIAINDFCEKYTTKNIAEIGVILMIVIPIAIFVIKERRRK